MRGWNMLPEPAEEAIHAIADDRKSGASKLARIAVDTMGLAIMEAKGRPDPKELTEVARRISAAQPAMAIVHNIVHLVARLVSEGQDPKAVIDATRAELDGARSRIARTFLKIAPPRGIVVTLSSCEAVLRRLREPKVRCAIRWRVVARPAGHRPAIRSDAGTPRDHGRDRTGGLHAGRHPNDARSRPSARPVAASRGKLDSPRPRSFS